jgi:hypothetical protein
MKRQKEAKYGVVNLLLTNDATKQVAADGVYGANYSAGILSVYPGGNHVTLAIHNDVFIVFNCRMEL